MSNEFILSAEKREDGFGKGASRRLRRTGLVPAIIYGGEGEPSSITLQHRHIVKALENEAFYSHILTVDVAGKKEKVLLKDLQRHPFKPFVMHMDFQRVSGKDILTRPVHLHFLGEAEAPGVKEGGIIAHHMKDIEITCAARDLPEYIEVDLSTLELDQVLHISDIKPPKGVTIVAATQGEEHNLPVAAIHLPRVVVEEEEEAEPEEGEEAEGTESAEGAEGEEGSKEE